MKTKSLVLIGGFVLVLTLFAIAVCRFVWPPDIFGRVIVLASAQARTGERFRVVQFWTNDFYRTQLEDISPDGSTSVAVIDGDDRKQWSCSIDVLETEKKVMIALPTGTKPIEYRWDEKRFVRPPGQARLRE